MLITLYLVIALACTCTISGAHDFPLLTLVLLSFSLGLVSDQQHANPACTLRRDTTTNRRQPDPSKVCLFNKHDTYIRPCRFLYMHALTYPPRSLLPDAYLVLLTFLCSVLCALTVPHPGPPGHVDGKLTPAAGLP